jgi:hypothetical protein
MMFGMLITALLLTLSVIPCPAMAESVKIPAAYHGVWCAIGDYDGKTQRYKRCRKADGEQDWEIRARHFFNDEVSCIPLAVKPKGNSLLVRLSCRHLTVEEEKTEPVERWRLTDGGRRLEINETSNKAE